MEDAWTFVCIVRKKKKIFDSRLDQPGGGEHKIKMSDIHGSPSCCVLRVVLPCGLILTPPKNDNNDDNNKKGQAGQAWCYSAALQPSSKRLFNLE